MDTTRMLIGLLFVSIMLLILGWVYFVDMSAYITWLVGKMAPKKRIEEIEQYKKLRNNGEYKKNVKRHKRKWRMRFLIPIPIYAVVYVLSAFLFRNLLLAFFVAFWPSLIVFDRLATKEAKERQSIIDLYSDKSA